MIPYDYILPCFAFLTMVDCIEKQLFHNSQYNEATIHDFIEDDTFFEVLYPEDLRYTYRLRKARDFGGLFKRELKEANLVLAHPLDCCSALYNIEKITGAIALVSRGYCSFLSKAVKAEESGAIAVIIMDYDEENDKLIDMVSDGTERHTEIPVYFLLGINGQFIHRKLLEKNIDSAIINIPVNLTSVPIHKLNQAPWLRW